MVSLCLCISFHPLSLSHFVLLLVFEVFPIPFSLLLFVFAVLFSLLQVHSIGKSVEQSKPCCHVFNFFSNIFLLKSSCVCCSLFRFVRFRVRLMRKNSPGRRAKNNKRATVSMNYGKLRVPGVRMRERERERERERIFCVWFNQLSKMGFRCHCRRKISDFRCLFG